MAKKDKLTCFNSLLKDSNLTRLLYEIVQIKDDLNYKYNLIDFANETVKVCGCVNESLESALRFAVKISKQMDYFPETEFEVTTSSGESRIINSSGRIIKGKLKSEAREDDILDLQAKQLLNLRNIKLNGLSDVRFNGYNDIFNSLKKINLSDKCINDFLCVGRKFEENWDINRLFKFYSEEGNQLWISPVRELQLTETTIRNKTKKRKNSLSLMITSRYRKFTLNHMANAGRLGFCPGQFLKQIIRPYIRVCKNPEVFSDILDIFFEAIKYVNHLLRINGGDGSASNIFTLKYFVGTLSNPKSKLFNHQFYDDEISVNEVFRVLGTIWAEMFPENKSDNQNIFQTIFNIMEAYLGKFLSILTAVEIASEIIKGFKRAADHCRILSDHISPNDISWYTSIIILNNVERKMYSKTQFLKFLYKHIEVIETLADNFYFKSRYGNYLKLLSMGAFKSIEDIDGFLEMQRQLPLKVTSSPDTIDFISLFIKDARNSKKREKMLEFMQSSPLLDSEIYRAWKDQNKTQKKMLLKEVEKYIDQYLFKPSDKNFKSFFGINYSMVEDALVVKLVKSSHLNKRSIYHEIKKNIGLIPKVPECFQENKTVKANYILREKIDKQLKNKDIKFLNRKIALLFEITLNQENTKYETERLIRLISSAKSFHFSIQRTLNELIEQNNPGHIKKIDGLKEQLKIPSAYIEFLNILKETKLKDEKSRLNILKICLLVLGYAKSFYKQNAEEYIRLCLIHQWHGNDPNKMLEEPYSVLENLKGDEKQYSLKEINAVENVYLQNSLRYFLQLFNNKSAGLPPALSVAFNNFLEIAGLKHLLDESDVAKAEFFYNIFKKYQSLKQLAVERKILLETIDKIAEVNQQELSLVCGKRKIDKFYGHIGENCTSMFPEEIKRRDFFPVRIINTETVSLEGYIHFVEAKYKRQKILIVPGIEPKMSLLNNLDPVDFYIKIKMALLEIVKKNSYAMLAYSVDPSTHSNRFDLARLMRIDMENKPVIKIGSIYFPKFNYPIGTIIVMWSNSKITIPLKSVRYSAEKFRTVFYS